MATPTEIENSIESVNVFEVECNNSEYNPYLAFSVNLTNIALEDINYVIRVNLNNTTYIDLSGTI